jgi:DNA-binding PadR family transcriptional regulator
MELCEYLGPIPPPGILLHELVVAGLVTTSDASDITSAWYELTEAGRTALAGARANGFWECKTSVQEPRKPKSS